MNDSDKMQFHCKWSTISFEDAPEDDSTAIFSFLPSSVILPLKKKDDRPRVEQTARERIEFITAQRQGGGSWERGWNSQPLNFSRDDTQEERTLLLYLVQSGCAMDDDLSILFHILL